MMTANEIRDSYKKFFESKGHVIVPSAPMVIKDDPTLMFTNAGMNQWKDIILGTKDPEPTYFYPFMEPFAFLFASSKGSVPVYPAAKRTLL